MDARVRCLSGRGCLSRLNILWQRLRSHHITKYYHGSVRRLRRGRLACRRGRRWAGRHGTACQTPTSAPTAPINPSEPRENVFYLYLFRGVLVGFIGAVGAELI
jgi:hypothetical protein